MHALGFWHEHRRSDRDNYITVNLTNIAPEMRQFWYKAYSKTINEMGSSYDYCSVMHYPDTGYPGNAFTPLNKPSCTIGQRKGIRVS